MKDIKDDVEIKIRFTAQLHSAIPAYNCKVHLTPEQGDELLQYMNEHPEKFDERGCFIDDVDE